MNAPRNITSSYVIYGLGGVGKSQVAMQYCYVHHKDFDFIHWLRADDYGTLLTSYLQLYQATLFQKFSKLNVADETNHELVATRIKLWFEQCEQIKWLLVVDNADSLERDNNLNLQTISEQPLPTLGSMIPRGKCGCVLVTSRDRRAVGQLGTDGIELLVMKEDEAKQFLQRCSKADIDTDSDAFQLLCDLGRLPLAIEQAGGYIREHGVTIEEYRKLYNQNKSEALRKGLSATHKLEYYHETVATTWNISFQAIQKKDPIASTILQIAAFLDGEEIQKDLFYNAELDLGDKKCSMTEWVVNDVLGTLLSYSLIQPVKAKESISIHLLVQSIVRERAGTKQLNYFVQSAELIERRFPWGANINNRSNCLRYLAQAQNCIGVAEMLQVETIVIKDLLESLAGYFIVTGQFKEAFKSGKRALKINEREFGVDHINSADTIANIGSVCYSQGKYADAISWHERALKIIEREFGVDHINSANTINNIGEVLRKQGKYADAISWHERALKIKEREFGVDHINSANTINNIGVVLDKQGKYADAISWCERALKINEREFGVDHINSANTINNIGVVLRKQGKYADAISWYERALKIQERNFGVDNINSATTITNIGVVYLEQGHQSLAKQQLIRGYQIFQNNLGDNHPDTIYSKSLVDSMEDVDFVREHQGGKGKWMLKLKKAFSRHGSS